MGLLFSGYLLALVGFEPGTGIVQGPDVVWQLCGVTLLVGPAISLISLALIRLYPVDRELLHRMRDEHARTVRPSV